MREKSCHTCPECGKKWQCKLGKECTFWNNELCKCPDCTGKPISDSCNYLIWSIS